MVEVSKPGIVMTAVFEPNTNIMLESNNINRLHKLKIAIDNLIQVSQRLIK